MAQIAAWPFIAAQCKALQEEEEGWDEMMKQGAVLQVLELVL